MTELEHRDLEIFHPSISGETGVGGLYHGTLHLKEMSNWISPIVKQV